MKENFQNVIVAGCCVLAGYLAATSGTPDVPEVDPTPVSVGAPPDLTLGMVKCECSGNCECSPACLCKEPDECQPAKAAPEPSCTFCNAVGATRVNGQWVRCAICGGDGVISDDPRDPESQPDFKPAPVLYTQPAPKPAAVQVYSSSCANGSCGSGTSRGSFRLLRRRR